MGEERAATPGRLASLDVLRAVAVFLVLGRHWPAIPRFQHAVPGLVCDAWQRGGWVGVDLFFVLSGFLVSGLIFRELHSRGHVEAGRFWVRRAFKIFPAFYVLLAATLAGLVDPGVPVTLRGALGETLYLQNYLGGLWDHTWSLAVEEHFYLLLPCVLVVGSWMPRCGRPSGAHVASAFAFVALACLALRCSLATLPFSTATHLVATHLRLDSLAFGVALSFAAHFRKDAFARLEGRFVRTCSGLTGAVLLAPAFVFPVETTPRLRTIGLTLFYVGSGLLLVAILPLRSRDPVSRALAFVGRHSYSIYLWHLPVNRLVSSACARSSEAVPTVAWHVAYLAGAIAAGVVLGKLVEVPMLRLRDRFFPSLGGTLRT